MPTEPSAAIYGLAGVALTVEERAFFADAQPFGFILFARNCREPAQIIDLVAELRQLSRADAPVLIDQEGGRVQRLRPPHWRAAPPARRFGSRFGGDPDAAVEAARLNARLIAAELIELGIDVDCAPVLDLAHAGAHDVIGDRAFAREPDVVVALAQAFMEGLRDGGVMPVIKHLPGHGRARVDSHLMLPVIEASLDELEHSDFAPFRALGQSDRAWAMTAHLIFPEIDPDRPATVSARVIGEVIRGRLGFEGLLLSDDLSMQALSGSLGERAGASLAAGCDVALHCNGDFAEMRSVAATVGPLSATARARAERARATLPSPRPFDRQAAEAALAELMADV